MTVCLEAALFILSIFNGLKINGRILKGIKRCKFVSVVWKKLQRNRMGFKLMTYMGEMCGEYTAINICYK